MKTRLDTLFDDSSAPCYVIAELSCNHNGSLDTAKALIDAAAQAGADCVKLQIYTADTISRNFGARNHTIRGTEWDGYTTYELYQKAHTPWEWYDDLFAHAATHKLDIVASPFDESAVDFLVEHGVAGLKIASFELIDHPLLRKVAQSGLPVIMSRGMSTLSELARAYEILSEEGCKQRALLHCNSGYPTPLDEVNLATIPVMKQLFDTAQQPALIGLSDHSMWMDNATRTSPAAHIAPAESVRLGARLIEVHLTMSRAEDQRLMAEKKGGFDWPFSREPQELAHMVQCIRAVEADKHWQFPSTEEQAAAAKTIGSVMLQPTQAEIPSRQMRPSLYCTNDIKQGEPLRFQGGTKRGNIDSIRPGGGLDVAYAPIIDGAAAQTDIAAGEPIGWHHVLQKTQP
jgi:sialic acid synthase SpsE